MYKLAVFDLDGTLLDEKHELSRNNINAVNRLKKFGVNIALATGRPDQLVKEYIHKLNLKDPIITCNGACIRNPLTGVEWLNKIISKTVVSRVAKMCFENGYQFMAYSKDGIISQLNDRVKYFMERNNKLPKEHHAHFIISSNANYISEKYDVNKILIIERDPNRYKELYNELLKLGDVSLVRSQTGFLDVMPKGTSKMEALKILANYYGVSRNEIIAFGDQDNDLEMLKYAGYAITTSNGVESVKQIADYVSKDHNESGVAYAIEHVIIKKLEKIQYANALKIN